MDNGKKDEKWIGADCKLLHYMGRIDFTDEKNPIWIYPCTCVRIRFTGNYIKASVTNIRAYWTNYLGIILDDVESKVQLKNEGKQEFVLGENLGDGEHELLFFKRMDSCHMIQFHGFAVERNAEVLPLQEIPRRRIEVYGDSVSAGEVSEAVAYTGLPDPVHDGAYSNSYYSYAWILARKLNAQIHDIAQGGAALLNGTGYFHAPDYLGMEYIYDKMQYHSDIAEVKQWDFSKYTPHLVVIAIGQNDNYPEDYMTNDYMGEKAICWRNRYFELIQKLRRNYPKAIIILTTTILNHSEAWDFAIEDVCTRLNDKKIYHFLYSNNGRGTQGHIRIPEAERMAEELYTFINALGEAVWEEEVL